MGSSTGSNGLRSAAPSAWRSRTRTSWPTRSPLGSPPPALFGGGPYPTLMRALEHDGPTVVDIPIDYRENLRLTERLGALSSTG